MAQFDVKIDHALSEDDARERLKGAQPKLESEYGVKTSWNGGGDLIVTRKGLDGTVKVQEQQLLVTVKLGFLLSAMGGTIKQGITEKLTKLMKD